jgi:hypothetical protein
MSGLFLSCGFCGRKQADGLISRGFWGHLEIDGSTTLRACPTCKEHYSDWENRLLVIASNGADDATSSPRYGATYR